MRNFRAIIGVSLIFSAVLVVSAVAQGYVIQRPGQSITTVHPNDDGTSTIITPGQSITTVHPEPDGYTIVTPGQSITTIRRPQQNNVFGGNR
jgi:hypothetical protein